MNAVRTELMKSVGYRVPLLLALAGVALTGLWDLGLVVRGASAGDTHRMLDSGLAMGGVILPVVWFALPLTLVSADVSDGSLRPALIAVPGARRVLAAKWVASATAAVLVAAASWGLLLAALATRPDVGAVLGVALTALPRLVLQALACVTLGLALHVVSGYRGAPWTVLGLLVWIHLIERVLGSALPGTAGMMAIPFRLVDFWVRGRWADGPDPRLDALGFVPLCTYVIIISLVVGRVFQRFADSSGRPWGRKHG